MKQNENDLNKINENQKVNKFWDDSNNLINSIIQQVIVKILKFDSDFTKKKLCKVYQ